MPARSEKQRKFMGGCLNPKSRRKMGKKCPSKKVARKFARKP